MGRRHRWPLLALLLLAELAAAGPATAQEPTAPDPQSSGVSVRITSPLGRTGVVGTVRIVAQIQAPNPIELVRFYVNTELLGADTDGPPYAVEWFDDNPFEAREIVVDARDVLGRVGRDTVLLKAFEILEISGITSVLLEVSVQEKSGGVVRGLDASKFALTEDGVPQTVELVSEDSVSATLAMLVDSSQSMSRRMDFVRRTAESLSGFLGTRNRMLVVPFTRTLGPVTGPTADRPTIVEALSAMRPVVGTAIVDSIVATCKLIENVEGRRAIVLVTDGYDEHSTGSFDDAMIAAKAAHVTVYVIGVGGVAGISLKGERLLRRLAQETGGRAFFPTREDQVQAAHAALVEDIENRYLVGYTPSNQAADGAWRSIALTTVSADHVVRTRPGYFAHSPPPVQATLEFTATDGGGRFMELTSDAVTVIEDGVPQKIEAFQDAVAPVSIYLVLDQSGSMRRSASEVMEAGREFVRSLRPQDGLAVVLFADQPTLAQDLTTNRDPAFRAIDSYVADGGTALYDAIIMALAGLKQAEGRRAVVVLTDGRDENNPGTAPGSLRSLEDALATTREVGAAVFAVALGANVDQSALQQFARVSGGQTYSPATEAELTAKYKEVVENLRRRYVLGYTSTNSKRDGAWRKVEIRVRDADATVLSREGYFAPEAR